MPEERSYLPAARRWLARLTGPAPMRDFEDYDGYWAQRGREERVLRRWVLAASWLPDTGTLLDVGCGGGDFLKYLRTVRPGITARGVDLSAEAVSRTRAAGFEAEVLDPARQDLPGGPYDFVTCFEVLEHIADAEAALRKLKAAFTQQLIVSVPNIGHFSCRLRLAVFGRFPLTRVVLHVKEHVRHWTPKDFRDWTDHEGLRLVKAVGDWGTPLTPWRVMPSLFCAGMVYVLEHPRAGGPRGERS
jgi:2-polyprenyl-3-methyl-5-hydroxy-6-metoxy-1,4-benzoquinol methylase